MTANDPMADQLSRLACLPLADRISLIAKDVKSRKDEFRAVGPYDLAELLSVQTDGAANWPMRCNYVLLATIKERIDMLGGEPDAILDWLSSSLSTDRLAELHSKLQHLKMVTAVKLERLLSEAEITSLLHADAQWRLEAGDYLSLAITEVNNNEGVPLMFECLIGDGGEVDYLKDPYDFRDGTFTDTSDAAIVDPCG